MTTKALAAIGAAILMIVLCCSGGGAAIVTGAAAAACGAATTSPSPTATPPPPPPPNKQPAPAPSATYPAIGPWNTAAVGNAAIIIDTGQQLGVPARGWVIAVATAMQESSLQNRDGGAGDSLGLFQQRPSQGWGTVAQIMDPVHASTAFYQHLLTVPDWQTMALTDAAQAVQRSAYPDAYAKWEPDATQVVTVITGGTDAADCAVAAELPTGFTLPADTPTGIDIAIGWAFEQLGTPYQFGGDCTASHSGIPAHRCDCSSLTQQAYQAAGLHLPRTADEQSRYGQLITDPAQLKPGDLIFTPGADGTIAHPGHVGMYLGDNLVIEAPHTGDYVKIVPYGGDWVNQQAAIRRQITWP